MRRVLYVPNEQDVERAEQLAKSTKLPIQIGDSESTIGINFDRKEIQIVSIPLVRDISCHDLVHSQISFYCDIVDEWVNFLDSDIYILISNAEKEEITRPKLKEVNYVRFCPRINTLGSHSLKVILNSEIYYEKDISVI